MLEGLESGNNVRLTTARRWNVVVSLLFCLAVATAASGCGLWADDVATTPTLVTTVTTDTTMTSTAMATQTATVAPTATSVATTTATTSITTPVATSTPQPTVAIDDLTPSTQLAYFHSVSADGESPEFLAQTADFIILTYGDEQYRDALRQFGYTGLILQYLNASQVNGPGPYTDARAECDAQFAPLRNGIARGVGDFCTDLHPNEDWFLHNGAGARLYSIADGVGVWYHMDPGNREWRAYASQAIARDIVGPEAAGFDGAFLDNVELSLTRLYEQVANSDGVVREFANHSDYRSAWSGYLQQIRVGAGTEAQIWASLVSDPNRGAYWSAYYAELDGVMSPAFATGYDPLSVAAWENNIEQAEAAIRNGRHIVAVSHGERGDAAWQQFALASFLLISDGQHAYFRYMSDESRESLLTLWTYPNYEIRLGAALGSREWAGDSWRRDFQCGYVEVDPRARTGEIVQTGCEIETETS